MSPDGSQHRGVLRTPPIMLRLTPETMCEVSFQFLPLDVNRWHALLDIENCRT